MRASADDAGLPRDRGKYVILVLLIIISERFSLLLEGCGCRDKRNSNEAAGLSPEKGFSRIYTAYPAAALLMTAVVVFQQITIRGTVNANVVGLPIANVVIQILSV